MLSQFVTEVAVGLMFVVFSFLARSFFSRMTTNLNNAVKRIEEVGRQVHQIEVKNAERLAELGAHVQNIYERLNRRDC